MTEEKNQTQKVEKTLSVSYRVKSLSRKEKVKVFAKFFYIFLLSFAFVLLGFYASVTWIDVFPDFLPIATANDLLNIMINVNGILLGFVGIVFAQILSSIMDQQNILYQSMLEKPDEASNKTKSLEFLDLKRYTLSFTTFFTLGFLITSIFASMSNIAMISQFKPEDTYSTFTFLFGPFLFTIIAVILLAISLMAVPLRPPLEKSPPIKTFYPKKEGD